MRWPSTGSRTAGGPPVTTAVPAPASAWSTWWPRRSRRPAGARGPGRISQLEAGCRYDSCPRRRPAPGRVAGARRSTRPCGPEGVTDVRVRFRFAKLGKVRFTSQRDVARMWERALRRAGVADRLLERLLAAAPAQLRSRPPDRLRIAGRVRRRGLRRGPDRPRRPRGLHLAVGTLGPHARGCRGGRRRPGRARPVVPAGAGELLRMGDPPAGSRSTPRSRRWSGPSSLLRRCRSSRERKGRVADDDIRPSVLALAAAEVDGEAALVAETATHPRGVRPAELVQGIVVAAGAAGTGETARNPVIDRACRTQQWIERDGCRVEPLPAGDGRKAAGRAVHTVVCAS